MSNGKLRWLLLRLEAMQHVSRLVGLEIREATSAVPGGEFPRHLLASCYVRLNETRDDVVRAMRDIQLLMQADALTRGGEILGHESTHAVPVCEFSGCVESATEG